MSEETELRETLETDFESRQSTVVNHSVAPPGHRSRVERNGQSDLLTRLEQILHARIKEMYVCAEFAEPLATPVAVMHQHVAKLRIGSIAAGSRVHYAERNETVGIGSAQAQNGFVGHPPYEILRIINYILFAIKSTGDSMKYEEYEKFLKKIAETPYGRLKTAGYSREKDAVYALTISDFSVPDDEKFNILIAGLHVGGEFAALSAAVETIKFLM